MSSLADSAVMTAADIDAAGGDPTARQQVSDLNKDFNASKPMLLNRANHTGTQAVDTIDAFKLERRYAYGRRVIHARADLNYGLGDAITADGYHLANYGIRVSGMGWTRNAVDGFWELDGTQLLKSAPSISFADGSSIAPSSTRYYAGLAVRWGVAGPDGITSPFFVLEDGTVVAQKLVSPSILTPAGVIALQFPSVSFASGAAVDSTSQRYYGGHAVRKAFTDADGRASLIELDDGTIVIPKLSSPSVITDPSGFSFGAVNFSTGDAIMTVPASRYFAGKKIKKAWTDSTLAASLVELEDGTIVIPKLSSPALDLAGGTAALETANFMFHETTAGGMKQLRRTLKSTGVRFLATSTGNNFAPRLSFDGSKIVYLSDRTGAKESWYQLLDGSLFGSSIEHPVIPYFLITPLGDSIMATGWIDGVATYFGVPLSTPSSVPNIGSTTAGGGIGSQRSIQIAARYGACGYAGLPALTCSLVNNTMAAGDNQLTAISVPLISRGADALNPTGDGSTSRRTLRASLLGITGLLTSVLKASADSTTVPAVPNFSVDNYTYTFTPDAGQTLPSVVPAGSVLVIDPEIRQDCVLVVHVGRNDVGARYAQANINFPNTPAGTDTITINGTTFAISAAGVGANTAATQVNVRDYINANFPLFAAAIVGSAVVVKAISGGTNIAAAVSSTAINVAIVNVTGWFTEVKLAVAAIMAAYKPLIQRIVLIGVTNARSEPIGTSNYNQIVALNADLAAMYPGSFFDVRPFYNAGEATDIPAAANTDDGLHPNSAGRLNGFTIPVRNFIASRGWFS